MKLLDKFVQSFLSNPVKWIVGAIIVIVVFYLLIGYVIVHFLCKYW